MPLSLDASTPAALHQARGNTGSAQSATFSPPANSLVVVNVAWLFDSSQSGSTLTVQDNLTNVYTQVAALSNIQRTSTCIAEHYYSSAPGAIAVTVSCSTNAFAAVEVVIQVIDGANSVQSGAGATTDNDDGNLHITTTTSGSWVYVVATSPTSVRAPVADVTLTQLDFFNAGTNGQGATGKVTKTTSIPGKILTGWNANMVQASAVEIIPAAPVLQGNGGTPGPTWNIGQVLASADCNTWLVPLAQQKLNATGRNNTLGGTTLSPDPDLQLPFISGNYQIRLVVVYDGPSPADLIWGFSIPPGATLQYLVSYQNTSGNLVLQQKTQAGTPTANTQGIGSPLGLIIDGMLQMGATPGSVSFLWCQAVGNSGNTTVYQNSYFTAWRLG